MSDQLHALVHSLEKSERRFLRLYAELGAGPTHGNCMTLLDAILAQPVWDESKLLATLPPGPQRDHLSSTKTRLQDLILKSQRLLHSDKDVHATLRNHLSDIEYLITKSLFPLALKRLRKAKALARHYEEEVVLSQLLHLELQLSLHNPVHHAQALLDEEFPACIMRLRTVEQYNLLYERLRLHVRIHGRSRTQVATAALAAIHADPLLSTPPDPAVTRYAYLLHQQVLGTYHLVRGEIDQALAIFEPLLALWEEAPELISHRPQVYISCLNNYLGTCLSSKATHPRFLSAIASTRRLQGLAPHTRIWAEQVTYIHELSFRFNFSTLQASQGFIAELSAWLDNHAARREAAPVLSLYHNLALFHFVYGAHKAANAWLQRILNHPDTTARADIRSFAPILQLVLQYELLNFDLTDYLLRNARRRMQREDKHLALETAVLEWFKRLQKASLQSTAAQRNSLQQLLSELRALEGHPGRPPLGLQELIVWAESHLEGVPLAVHFQKKMFG